MAEHGEPFEAQAPVERVFSEEIHDMFCRYFNSPIMYKIKDVGDKSIYMCKLYCLLSRECRYVVSIVSRDPFQPKRPAPLKDQRLYCLQTRTLADDHALAHHDYNSRIVGPWSAKIKRTGISDDTCHYDCAELGLKVSLLLNGDIPEKYQPHGSLHSALETFQTVVTVKTDIA